MKNQILLYALVLVTVFGGVSAAFAQEGDEYAECTQLLNSPPFDDVLSRNDGHDFGQLDARRQGAALLGMKCSPEELQRYFESAGWEHRRSHSYDHPMGPYGGEIKYYTDSFIAFCQKTRVSINLYFLKCTKSAVVDFLEGEITSVRVGGTK
jgi:hypothetical protein